MAVNINVPSQVKTYANLAAFPATGALKTIYIAEDTNKTYRWTGSVYTEISASAAMTWGAIGGTLSNQTDLQSALDAKVPTSRTLTINGVTQDLSANRTFSISTGITIGTTAIASGTVGRILFEGAGNVVQESSSLFWDNTNVRLGVGTSTPITAVEVKKTGSDSWITASRGTNTFHAGFLFNPSGSWTASNVLWNFGLYANTNDLRYWTYNGSTDTFVLNLFGSTANVGIGTTTDAGFRLDVNGTARVQNVLTIQNLTADLYVRTTAWSGQSRIWFGDDSSDTIGGINYEHQFDRMNLRTNAGTRMSIFSTGNIGINTTTDAGFRLDVNGTARFNGNLTFQTTSWILDNSNAIMHRGGFNVESIAFNSSRMVFTDNNGFVFNGNNSAATLTASSIVDIQSTTKGFLPPRMTTTQKNAIASPAAGLMVYDTTLNVISYYNGSMWI